MTKLVFKLTVSHQLVETYFRRLSDNLQRINNQIPIDSFVRIVYKTIKHPGNYIQMISTTKHPLRNLSHCIDEMNAKFEAYGEQQDVLVSVNEIIFSGLNESLKESLNGLLSDITNDLERKPKHMTDELFGILTAMQTVDKESGVNMTQEHGSILHKLVRKILGDDNDCTDKLNIINYTVVNKFKELNHSLSEALSQPSKDSKLINKLRANLRYYKLNYPALINTDHPVLYEAPKHDHLSKYRQLVIDLEHSLNSRPKDSKLINKLRAHIRYYKVKYHISI